MKCEFGLLLDYDLNHMALAMKQLDFYGWGWIVKPKNESSNSSAFFLSIFYNIFMYKSSSSRSIFLTYTIRPICMWLIFHFPYTLLGILILGLVTGLFQLPNFTSLIYFPSSSWMVFSQATIPYHMDEYEVDTTIALSYLLLLG